MSATDELRRLLDERGVAHSDHYLSTTWRDGHGMLHLAGEPMADGSLVVDMLTPEQAIAATLGSEFNPDGLPVGLTISDDSNLLNWRGENYVRQSALCGGKLTAEQVREAIISADRWEKPMGNTGLTNTHLIIRDDGWQAIADELNATLENGTCELAYGEDDEGYDGWYTRCGGWFAATREDGRIIRPLFCQLCGNKAVVK